MYPCFTPLIILSFGSYSIAEGKSEYEMNSVKSVHL